MNQYDPHIPGDAPEESMPEAFDPKAIADMFEAVQEEHSSFDGGGLDDSVDEDELTAAIPVSEMEEALVRSQNEMARQNADREEADSQADPQAALEEPSASPQAGDSLPQTPQGDNRPAEPPVPPASPSPQQASPDQAQASPSSAEPTKQAPQSPAHTGATQTSMYALRGRIVTPRSIIVDGAVVIAGDAIAWIGQATDAKAAGYGQEIIEAASPIDDRFILPGLVDVHNHGGAGILFPTAHTHDDVMKAVMDHRRHGTTSMVASLVSANPIVLRERAELLADVCDRGELAGIHFEGPFLADKHRGVHDPTSLQSPNPALARELQVVSRGHCVSMTIAPEKTYAMGPSGVVETLIAGNCVPSFGHTDISGRQMRKVLREVRERLLTAPAPRCSKATITHMYNGMAAPHHRNPGPVMEILADAAGGGVICELIADGVHVAAEYVTTTYELIGREQIAFVTDSVATGAPDGLYDLGTTKIEVRDGAALTLDGAIGGGGSYLIDIVRRAHEGGIPLIDAVYCASAVPASIIGDDTIGAIEVGKRADLLVVDGQLRPLQVVRRGQTVV